MMRRTIVSGIAVECQQAFRRDRDRVTVEGLSHELELHEITEG
jgi:hypothetical protein